MKKVYLVGHNGPEHDFTFGVYANYDDAYKEFQKIRKELLQETKNHLKLSEFGKSMWKDMIKNLKEKDPNKIDCYPHNTPYIREEELK